MTVTWWVALNEKGNYIQIESSNSVEEYSCPECKIEMVTRKGEVRKWHFAHKPLDDGTERECGGEGYRHYRVKTLLYTLLDEVRKSEFFYDFELKMERSQEGDIPDISLEFIKNNTVYAIEIVDTNPPSEEKKKRWKDRMYQIPISRWSDAEISNAVILSGLLIPTIIRFRNLMEQVREENNLFRNKLDEINDENKVNMGKIKEKHNKKIERVNEQNLKNLDKLVESHHKALEAMNKDFISERADHIGIAHTPEIWSGSMANLKKYEGFSDKDWGISVKFDNGDPSEGDYAIVKIKNGNFRFGIIGKYIENSSHDYHKYYINYYEFTEWRNAPDMKDLFLKLTRELNDE